MSHSPYGPPPVSWLIVALLAALVLLSLIEVVS